jgi:flagellar protein FlgJ
MTMELKRVSEIRVEQRGGVAPAPGAGAVRADARLEKAARRFETMVIEGMVREMWKTIPVSKREGQSAGLSLANELYQKELSKDLVKSGGFGLARQIVEDTRKKEGSVVAPALPHDHPAGLSVIV